MAMQRILHDMLDEDSRSQHVELVIDKQAPAFS
jgi:hypothetical protein